MIALEVDTVRYKCIKEIPSGIYLDLKEAETIPVGTICEEAEFDRLPAISYKGKAICDPDSEMGKEHFIMV